MNSPAHDQPATKDDLLVMKNEIVQEISDVLADVMTNVGMNFQELKGDFQGLKGDFQELKIEVQAVKASVNRIEHKLDGTVDTIDDHGKRIARLEVKAS